MVQSVTGFYVTIITLVVIETFVIVSKVSRCWEVGLSCEPVAVLNGNGINHPQDLIKMFSEEVNKVYYY